VSPPRYPDDPAAEVRDQGIAAAKSNLDTELDRLREIGERQAGNAARFAGNRLGGQQRELRLRDPELHLPWLQKLVTRARAIPV
jgi:hypothetical protein